MVRVRERVHKFASDITVLREHDRITSARLDRAEQQVGEIVKADELEAALRKHDTDKRTLHLNAYQKTLAVVVSIILLANSVWTLVERVVG